MSDKSAPQQPPEAGGEDLLGVTGKQLLGVTEELGVLQEQMRSLSVRSESPGVEDLARGVESLAGEVEKLAQALLPLVARLASLERGLDGAAGAADAALRLLQGGMVKRLPEWAMRQSPQVQRWLAQLPQEVLDSPFLERTYAALATVGAMANDQTLGVLASRVHEQEAAARNGGERS